MKLSFINARYVAVLVLVPFLLTATTSADEVSKKTFSPPPRQQVIAFLTQSVEWYRNSSDQREAFIQQEDVSFAENTQALTTQILRLSFDYAKVVAALETAPSISSDQSSRPAVANQPQSEVQRLQKMEAQCKVEIQIGRNDVASRRRTIAIGRGQDQTAMRALLANSESRLKLLQSQCDSYRSLVDFVDTISGGASQNQGLSAIIDDLSRTVPEVANTGAPASTARTGQSRALLDAAASTISDLISALLEFRRKVDMLDRANLSTGKLAQLSQSLETPLSQYLNSALQNVNLATDDLQPGRLQTLRQQKIRLDALSDQITALSPAMIALDKQRVLFGIYELELARWRTQTVRQYTAIWKKLILRIAAFAVVIIVLLIIARTTRRVTLRYVHDTSHRRAILLAERIVLWLCILLVVAFAFGSNLSSLATFFGLLTAGLAVAMQNVILAVLGYMVLVGKLHLRIGDRIQISGVTGEIVELGLLELQVREFDIEERPTDRVVSFSNSFVFVSPSTGIFRYGAPKESVLISHEPLTPATREISIDQTTAKL